MILASLALQDGEISYTTEHDSMTASQTWDAWKRGEITVFHMLQWQTHHNGHFDINGNFITWR